MPDSNPSLVARTLSPLRSLYRSIVDFILLKDINKDDRIEELSDLDGVRTSFLPFKGQQWYHHLLVFSLGTAIWIAVYAAIMYHYGWAEYAAMDTPEAITYRRQAATGAFAVTVTYYAILWTQARGGLMTNLLWFPALNIGLMPRSVLGLFTGKPEQRFSEGSFSTGPAQFSADAMSVLIPGYILFFVTAVVMMIYWTIGASRGHRHRVEWHRKWPDMILKEGPDEDWDELHDDLKEVYLEAGYDPEEDNGEVDRPADHTASEERSTDRMES